MPSSNGNSMSNLSQRSNRRQFIESTLLATATASLSAMSIQSPLFADETVTGNAANDRLGVAVVGVNGRGGSHIGGFSHPDIRCDVVAICDADEAVGQRRCDEIEKQSGRRPAFFQDIRKLLVAPGIDIVSIATPNHWHSLAAIWAVQHGKDVYVEKPVSHNVLEGRRLVEAARKHNRVVQAGTQSRSNPGMRELIAFIRNGGIGEIKLARGLCYKRRESIGAKGTYSPPKTVDYDLYCGPAELAPITRARFHYDWHWQWNCGNGDLGNQGIHQMDIARWGLGATGVGNSVFSYGGRFGYEDAGETANTQVSVHDYGDKTLVFEVRGLVTQPFDGAGVGVIFYGTEGTAVVPSYDGGVVLDPAGKEVKRFKGGDDNYHYANFVQAVRGRNPSHLNGDVEEGHLSSAMCHLGNISYRLGQATNREAAAAAIGEAATETQRPDAMKTFGRVCEHLSANSVDPAATSFVVGPKLTVDAVSETFVGDSQHARAAANMLSRDYRKGYELPTAESV